MHLSMKRVEDSLSALGEFLGLSSDEIELRFKCGWMIPLRRDTIAAISQFLVHTISVFFINVYQICSRT